MGGFIVVALGGFWAHTAIMYQYHDAIDIPTATFDDGDA